MFSIKRSEIYYSIPHMLNETIAKEDEIKYMKSPLSERTLAEYKPMGSAIVVTYNYKKE